MRLGGSERSAPEQNTGRSETGYWAVAYCMTSPGGVSVFIETLVTRESIRCSLIVKSPTDAAKNSLFNLSRIILSLNTLKFKDPVFL